ncbi:Zinc finger protein CONSTANS-LIKE 2 [Cardamine amara subsp. amara]|uniref:Zinc finger protein CONSTANS-LIKE 2 n=1 Tax=Cardamine amara subsp. amara TaxID=228776 RepID=A0ABD1AXA0_CARAN
MLKEESNESGTWARACDTCRSAACTVYCEADSAYLCTTCDARVHAANRLASRHQRVRVCQSCEAAPAAFLCKADAASLCTACDAEIHSANPLARRHQRVPILPLSSNSCTSMTPSETDAENDEDDREVASWLLPNPGKNSGDNVTQNNGFLFGVEYLDLVDYSSSMDNQFEDHQYSQYQRSFGGDGVVPLRVEESTSHLQQTQHNFQLGINYGFSSAAHNNNNFNGSLKDLNHTVSVSSMDISIVPESTASDITVQHSRTPKETIEQVSGPPTQIVQQLTPLEREARVLRYREKKKTRKFDKTIRYASRKAYAEIRPRIKGRFAKRIEIDAEAEQLFSTSLLSDTGYGIVPSF